MAADDDTETRLVEFPCRHRDLVTKRLYSYWLGTESICPVCHEFRKIIWTDDD